MFFFLGNLFDSKKTYRLVEKHGRGALMGNCFLSFAIADNKNRYFFIYHIISKKM